MAEITPDQGPTYDTPPIIPLHDNVADARVSGYSWEDIQGHLDAATNQALAAGYSQREIDDFHGYQSPTVLQDALSARAQSAIANAGDTTDHPAITASHGLLRSPDATDINPAPDTVRRQYANALINGEAKGPDDFARAHADATARTVASVGADLPPGYVDSVAPALASQLPKNEDVTDAAIAAVHAAGHPVTPDLVAITRENLLDRWADSNVPVAQSLKDAQKYPDIADSLTRARQMATYPSLDDLSQKGRDAISDPTETVENTIKYDVTHPDFNPQNLAISLATGGAGAEGSALSTFMKGTEGMEAGAAAKLAERANLEVKAHADGLMGDMLGRHLFGEDLTPGQAARATIQFNRGRADRAVAVAQTQLDQYVKATEQALPAHQDTIQKVRQSGGFVKYLDSGGQVDDLTAMKLYMENRTKLQLQNPFKEEHPLYGLADTLRDIYQRTFDRLEQNPLFNGVGYREDYYRHLWADQEKADRAYGIGRGGSSSALQERSIPTEMQGIERGLDPAIPSPIASTLHYLDSVLKYEANLNTLAMGRTMSRVKWSSDDINPPVPGYVRLLGKTANSPRKWTVDQETPVAGQHPLIQLYGPEGRLLLGHEMPQVDARANISGELEHQPPGPGPRQIGNETVYPQGEPHGGLPSVPGAIRQRGPDPAMVEWQKQHLLSDLPEPAQRAATDIMHVTEQRRINREALENTRAQIQLHQQHGLDTKALKDELAARTAHDSFLGNHLAGLRAQHEAGLAAVKSGATELESPEAVAARYSNGVKDAEFRQAPLPDEPHGNLPGQPRGRTAQSGGTAVGYPEGGQPPQVPNRGLTTQEGSAPRGPEGTEPLPGNAYPNPEQPPPEAMTKLVSYAWAHPAWARAYNSWIGQGFYSHRWAGPIYHALLAASNAATGLKLGLSGYHLYNISQETAIAGIARSLGEFSHGDLKTAMGNLGMSAAVLPEMMHMFSVGKDLESAYLRTGGSPMSQQLADIFEKSGGRIGGRQSAYRVDARDNLVRSFRLGKLGNEIRHDIKGIDIGPSPTGKTRTAVRIAAGVPRSLGVMADYAGRALDTFNAPLFDKLIPRIKQGTWASEMEDFIRQNPTADERALVTHGRQTMASIDDRFGEMNQDNLFWNRYAKQLANLFTVSIGWEYGSMRAFGHAALDIGTGHWNSTRARWLPAFLAFSAYQNSAYQYAKTNTLPHNLTQTFLAPSTGGKLPYGSPEGAVLPGYQKEIIRAVTEALKTPDFIGGLQNIGGVAASKINPFFQGLAHLATDNDWDSDSVRLKLEAAHGAPPEWWRYLENIADSMTTPVVAENLQKRGLGNNQTDIGYGERLAGIRPAGMNLSDPARYEQMMNHIHAVQLMKERRKQMRYNSTLIPLGQ